MFWLIGVALIVLIPVLAGVAVWYELRHELPEPFLVAAAPADDILGG